MDQHITVTPLRAQFQAAHLMRLWAKAHVATATVQAYASLRQAEAHLAEKLRPQLTTAHMDYDSAMELLSIWAREHRKDFDRPIDYAEEMGNVAHALLGIEKAELPAAHQESA